MLFSVFMLRVLFWALSRTSCLPVPVFHTRVDVFAWLTLFFYSLPRAHSSLSVNPPASNTAPEIVPDSPSNGTQKIWRDSY